MVVKNGVALMVLSAAATAVAASVEFDAENPQTSYLDGAVSVVYEDTGKISEISVDPAAAGGIDFTGGIMDLSVTESKFTFSSTGTVSLANVLKVDNLDSENPSLAIKSPSSACGDVSFAVGFDKLTSSDTFITSDMYLINVTNVTARFGQENDKTSGVPCDTVTCFFTNNGNTVTCQFQKQTTRGRTLRAVNIVLTQKADGIYAKTTGFGFLNITDTGIVEGDVYLVEGVATDWTPGYSSNIFASNVVLHSSCPRYSSRLNLTADNDIRKLAVTIGGDMPVMVNVDNAEAFPRYGSVEVSSNGCLQISQYRSNNVTSGIDNGVPITVRKGGVLATMVMYTFNTDRSSIVLDGGLLIAGAQYGKQKDTGVYVRNVTLSDGARMIGNALRTRNSSPTIKVEGVSPSYCDTGFCFWSTGGDASAEITFDVSDVNGGPEADFVISGPVYQTSTQGYSNAGLLKTGAGTVSFGSSFCMTNRPTRVHQGTMLFSADCMSSENLSAFVLEGGALAFSAGTVNSAGVLTVSASGAITVGEDASVSFADSSGVQWAQGVTVNVAADLGKDSLRFGTNSFALTEFQLRRFRSGGCRCRLDENGYLRVRQSDFFIKLR